LRQGLDHTTATGDDVFDDEDLFARLEFEITAQFELVVDLLEEHEAQAQLPRHFLADDEAAHGRADDCGCAICFQCGEQQFRQASDFVHVLADLSTLEEMRTVQAGAQQEMAVEEGAAIAENLKNFVVFGIHAGRLSGEA
jgi:hypothetical protein